jgi:glycosyltransferase involved in cell wall biosynthesis
MQTESTGSLVSVIIPCYNAERYVGEAIQSVLDQTYQSFEIIVVDDGSQDGSAAVLQQYPDVRYQYQENSGIGATRNLAIEMAEGDFFAFLDADDLWEKDKLARQLDAFAQEPDLDMIFGYVQQFLSPDVTRDPSQETPVHKELMEGYVPSAMMVRRASFLRVGLFATGWKMGEFIDWYARAQELGLKKLMLPEIVARRRIHDANNGIQQRAAMNDYLHILKKSLDRRKQIENQRPTDE